MNAIELEFFNNELKGTVQLPASKSLSNRWLIMQQAFPFIELINLSKSDDTQVLLTALNSNDEVIDIHHAGTAMRFLTAFYAVQEGIEKVLTGSSRMKNRPISELVNALKSIGTNILYADKDGYPPLKIIGKKLDVKRIEMDASLSSQYISAILLIIPFLNDEFTLNLSTKPTSVPYIQMTLKVLEQCGYKFNWEENAIQIKKSQKDLPKKVYIESDWSSASYFYSLLALSKGGSLFLNDLHKDSWQGDSKIQDYFLEDFGIITEFKDKGIHIIKSQKSSYKNQITRDFSDMPDMAQTWAVTCSGLKIPFIFTGLHTLKIKETDRLIALQNELLKIGVKTKITANSIQSISFNPKEEIPIFETYQDHRMALSLSALSVQYPIRINNPKVVSKSFPDYWNQLKDLRGNIQTK